ncbi:hypothetical protein PBI_HYPERION_98 [Microbacterium phage Hyperion]|uniref:Uncharacterized protein n=1 Tax=Microbacterium phage Hyperion TaxID=2182354 RepID=A0A2U8UJ16_9CAUD|nr:hypothetical protein HOT27_gp098 [Microbacterium phage Hyperion]AWN03613.1 hypothetical protein PBI_HYPERION_98 [Microbacterium phage Hyperion]
MSTHLNVRRANWGNVTIREYDALNTMRHDPEDIFAAALKWRDTYAVYAIVELGDKDMLPQGTPYFSESGEAWVRDIHARYLAAINDEPTLIELAREWVNALGTLATVNILRTIESR